MLTSHTLRHWIAQAAHACARVQEQVASTDWATGTDRIGTALIAMSVGFVLAGQWVLSWPGEASAGEGLVSTVFGAALFAVAVTRTTWRPFTGGHVAHTLAALTRVVADNPRRVVAGVGSVALAYVTVRVLVTKATAEPRPDVVATWLASMALFGVAIWPSDRRWLHALRSVWRPFAGMLVVGGVLRFAFLNALPVDIHMDELTHGWLAAEVLDGHVQNPFATWQSDGTLYAYALSPFVALFGRDVLATRLLPALAGTVTVGLLFLLGRRLFGFGVGMLAAGLLATSHISLHFSRSGFGLMIVDGMFATLSLLLVVLGLETRRLPPFGAAGVALGVAVYGYAGARAVPVVVGAYLVGLAILRPSTVRTVFLGGAVMAAGFAIAVAPLMVWAVLQPGEFWFSANAQSVLFNPDWLTGEAARLGRPRPLVVLGMLGTALLTLNHLASGNPVWNFYSATIPQLDAPRATLLCLGATAALTKLRDHRTLLPLVWIGVTYTLGGALVRGPEVSAYRLQSAAPAVCLLVAYGAFVALGLARRAHPPAYPVARAILALLLVVSVVLNLRAYFIEFGATAYYGPLNRTENPNAVAGIRAAAWTGQHDSATTVYFLGAPRLSLQTYYPLPYLRHGVPTVDRLEPLTPDLGFVDPNRRPAFVVLPEREGELAILRERYPDGVVDEVRRGTTLLFYGFRVP